MAEQLSESQNLILQLPTSVSDVPSVTICHAHALMLLDLLCTFSVGIIMMIMCFLCWNYYDDYILPLLELL